MEIYMVHIDELLLLWILKDENININHFWLISSLLLWIQPKIININHFWLISVLKFTGVVNWVVPLRNVAMASLAACSVGFSWSQYQYSMRLAHGGL